MNKAKITIKQFISCPYCENKEFRVDHLLADAKQPHGPWSCDNCGGKFQVSVRVQDVWVERLSDGPPPPLILLQYQNLLIGVKGTDHLRDPELAGSYYNEYICPINYLRAVELVVDLKTMTEDPHGIFEYVGSLSLTDETSETSTEKVMALLQERLEQPTTNKKELK